jgi:hypothetical protein
MVICFPLFSPNQPLARWPQALLRGSKAVADSADLGFIACTSLRMRMMMMGCYQEFP